MLQSTQPNDRADSRATRRAQMEAGAVSRAASRRAWARAAYGLPAIVLIGGLLVTCASIVVLWRSAAVRDRTTFLHATDIELRAIEDQFRTYTALLRGGAGLFAAENDTVSPDAFRAYVERIDLAHHYHGFVGIGFTRTLPVADVPQLVATMRAAGIADFHIHPVASNPIVSPVIFAEPPNPRNQAAIGFDVMSDPLRREMVERARDSGMSAASGRLQLVQEIDRNKQAGFLVAMPIYAGGGVPSVLEDRRRGFFGFIFGAFRADDLFSSIVVTDAEDDAAFAIYDGPPSEATLLHRSAPRDGSPADARYMRTSPLEIGGRTWTVLFTSRAALNRNSAQTDVWMVGAGGLLATVLLSLALLNQRRAQDEVQQLNVSLEARVNERTRDLQLANDQLREAGEERQRVEEQLRHSHKMEAVGQLTGGLAHDFNNLLTGITGSLELLQVRVGRGEYGNLDRYLTAAQGAASRAAALTHRLLAFARRQTLDPKPTNANRLVTEMEELVRRTVGPEITVDTVLAGDLSPTLCDPSQLENALLNLCINARDAMPGGGQLTIETGNVWFDALRAQERDMVAGQYVTLAVTDTGTGMPPDVVARAFDPFFTTKPLGQGTGLGLSMIYGFARQSGGQVRITSRTGQGTVVRIYLPRHGEEPEVSREPAELAAAPRAEAGETVMIVDDEPTVRMLVTEVLEELGYAAIEAADGASGLTILQSDERVDLLITDVGLPGGMNGRQMADAARIVRPDLIVLFITGYAETAVLGSGQLGHGMQVLTKPFTMEALATRIKLALRERAAAARLV